MCSVILRRTLLNLTRRDTLFRKMLEDILQQKILAYQALNKRKFADILKIVIVIRAKSIFNKFMKTMKALKNDS